MQKESIFLAKEEVIALDSRIKSCMVENPDEESSEYYAKIWFAYKLNNNNSNPRPDGRQEFVASSKHELIANVQHFMQSPKRDWCIIQPY